MSRTDPPLSDGNARDAPVTVEEGARVRNQPGEWDFFISHTQRNGHATALASKLHATLASKGFSSWLDVNMSDKSEAAMREGVVRSKCVIAIVTGPCKNPDRPGDPEEKNAYFARDYCCAELRWALEAGVPIQPVVRAEDKQRIGEFKDGAPDDLKDLFNIDFVDLNRSDKDYWVVGVDKILKKNGMMMAEGGGAKAPPSPPGE